MFNNGYNNFYPYQNIGARAGLFSGLKGKFNWSGLLNNTQKTLNIINQAIPVFYQIKPIWNNTKTIFKIMGAMKEDDNSKKTNTNYNKGQNQVKSVSSNIQNNFSNDNTPNFFL